MLLASVKRLDKALRASQKHIYMYNNAHMQIASVTGVDKFLFWFLVIVSAIINEALVLNVSQCFNG